MLTDMPRDFQKFSRKCEILKRLLRDTQNALNHIRNNNLLSYEIKEQLFNPKLSDSLDSFLDLTPAILVFGQNCHAKALFVNSILEQGVLPLFSSKWRWVKFSFGVHRTIRLTFGYEFEIVEKVQANEVKGDTIPEEDLKRKETESPYDHCITIDVELPHSLLQENVSILIPPDCSTDELMNVLSRNLDNVLPIITYLISEENLTDKDIQEIRILKEKYPDLPILFITIAQSDATCNKESLTESEQHSCEKTDEKHTVRNQLVRLGYLDEMSGQSNDIRTSLCSECSMKNILINDCSVKKLFLPFVRDILQSYLLKRSALLSEIHISCLRVFILSAFDMAREIQITPKRLIYAQKVEMKLYKSLMKIANEKQEEIRKIIQVTLSNMKTNVNDVLNGYQYECEDGRQPSVKVITMEIHQLVLRRLSNSVATQLVQSVACLQESFTGTLQRCLESLEKSCHETDLSLTASDAVKQILSAAYNIDLKSSTKFTIVHTFMDRLHKFIQNFQLPWTSSAQPKFDLQWQIQVVNDLIDSLSSSKLVKIISAQFQEHVKLSHESFKSAIRSLENQLMGKIEQTEEQRIAIRKRHAPKFARLTLESTSVCDLIRFGMPELTREIGRGQFGVVYSSKPWGAVNPCAIKSVVPPDDRHWNDLAMEFYYTRTIPEHPRIVKLCGSVIDNSYGGGSSCAVLLVMEQMTRDLYCGLKAKLSWTTRIQIAIDVVEGIRYLHSQGLVHRDIKLKNVLLDANDRAKLTDFGFCIPEAMMSGSIVGTPVHMAPELLSGQYDSSVDVYAFGILFWYICAGKVNLPIHFEQFHNKEQLWTSVQKGIRPECLATFTQDCWNLMEQCWAAEPYDRPLLGYVQPQLEAIQRNSLEMPGKSLNYKSNNSTQDSLMYWTPEYKRQVDLEQSEQYYFYDWTQLREY